MTTLHHRYERQTSQNKTLYATNMPCYIEVLQGVTNLSYHRVLIKGILLIHRPSLNNDPRIIEFIRQISG